MSIKAVLFDLDGTLLPMDQDVFVRAYIGGLVKVSAARGYDGAKMADAIMKGTAAMVKNTGEKTNEEVFWDFIAETVGESVRQDYHMYDEFYRTDFQNVADVCGFLPLAKDIVECVKEKGLFAVLATNPLFPSVATESRIRWAGLSPDDFEYFTTYENSRHCKPNLDYYKDILAKLGLSGEECVMVGNDVSEDMIARELGMQVFLLTPCLINRKNEDISVFNHGNAEELLQYIRKL